MRIWYVDRKSLKPLTEDRPKFKRLMTDLDMEHIRYIECKQKRIYKNSWFLHQRYRKTKISYANPNDPDEVLDYLSLVLGYNVEHCLISLTYENSIDVSNKDEYWHRAQFETRMDEILECF